VDSVIYQETGANMRFLCFEITYVGKKTKKDYVDWSKVPKKTKKDYVDWSKVPKKEKWVMIQPNGSVMWTEKKPYLDADPRDEWWRELSPDGKVGTLHDSTIGELPGWKDSLRKRPE
jgi:hypothetical protein